MKQILIYSATITWKSENIQPEATPDQVFDLQAKKLIELVQGALDKLDGLRAGASNEPLDEGTVVNAKRPLYGKRLALPPTRDSQAVVQWAQAGTGGVRRCGCWGEWGAFPGCLGARRRDRGR